MKTFAHFLPALLLVVSSVASSFAQSNAVGSGIAVSFPGTTGSRVDLGNVYNDLNFPVTVEAWVYPTSWTASGFSPIISTDNFGVGGSYYGFWFRFNGSGNLIFEIGDGSGAGGSDRRGKRTTTTVSLNAWTHVSVVANSITDISFYFNGVAQPVVTTDGGAVNTSILHSSYSAYLGCQVTPSAEHNFAGVIDEVRLWNVSRSITDLRDKMCEKLTGFESGLIGNWRFDEDYMTATVEDFSASGVDGNLIGSALKVTSGAAIGNISTFVYTTDYSGVSLSLTSPGGDKLKVNKIGYTPHGVHVYRVDDLPYFTEGLSSTPEYYYGVFPASNVTDAKYTLTYTYSFMNGVVNAVNESESTLFKRIDNSFEIWSFLPAPLDVSTNRLSKKNVLGKGEFIFSIDTANANGGARMPDLLANQSSSDLLIFPNPVYLSATVQGLVADVEYYIVSESGAVVFSGLAIGDGIQRLNLPNLASGIYFIVQPVDGQLHFARFMKQ